MRIKYTTFCQWRMEGDGYGPRSVTQTRDPQEGTTAFADLVKFYKVNIEQGDCHIEMVANIDAQLPGDDK